MNRAWAQKQKSTPSIKEWGALLSWEPMPGADLYQLEISEGKDFRTLILSIELSKPEFVFRSQKNPKELYWRVAAGTKAGRLGLFSEPEMMELVDARDLPQPETLSTIAKPAAKKAESPPKVVKLPQNGSGKITPIPPESNPPPAQNKNETDKDRGEVARAREHHLRFWWAPGLQVLDMDMDWPGQISSQGLQTLALGGEWQAPLSQGWDLHTLFHYQQSGHQPEPKDNYPFQEEITSRHLNLATLFKRPDSGWLWGAGLRLQPEPKRTSFEQIQFQDLWTPQAVVGWQNSTGAYQSRLHLGYRGQGLSVVHNHRLQYLHSWGFLLGIEYEGSWSQISTGQLVEHHLRTQLGFFF
jgi:hypothetical protein